MKNFAYLMVSLVLCLAVVSCAEKSDEWDAYANWPARNAQWWQQITDSALTNADGNWLRYKSLLKQQDTEGATTDYICVHVLQRGEGSATPVWTDTVRVNYRGWLMPTTYRMYNQNNVQVDSVMQRIFDQTYYGSYNPATAAPQKMTMGQLIEGYSTALQYMHVGDDWLVYIPSALAYKDKVTGEIPASSTLCFRIQLMGIYPIGQTVPDWK
ncbi:MAG: FKBP-type peptidyl-prolyl cis-trans isomerase [Bacteroidaceae bacterium]|nr:FKBP-type peptidyl-prolyl cis-trans isomerase [Bacteroidaceae bacterium]